MTIRDWDGDTPAQHIIVQLLTRYNELVDPMQAGNGEGDTGLRLMPTTYTRSVRELERLLAVMRVDRPSQWWHVTERFIRCQPVLRDVPVRRKTKHGKTVTVSERRLVPVYHRGVRHEKVRRGVAWLEQNWDYPRVGAPMLPNELLVAA